MLNLFIGVEGSLFGVPVFFLFWISGIIIFLSHFNKCFQLIYNQRYLFIFLIIASYYTLLSGIDSFGKIFSFNTDLNYLFRQAYFIPFIFTMIPVFIINYNRGMFKLLNSDTMKKYKFFYFITLPIVYYLDLFSHTWQYLTIVLLIFYDKNRFLSLLLFSFMILLHPIFKLINGDPWGMQYYFICFILIIFFMFKWHLTKNFFVSSLVFSFAALFLIGYYFNIRNVGGYSFIIASNELWRLITWVDNIFYTLKNTYGVGVGLGTSYFLSEDISSGKYFYNLYGPNYMGNPYHEDFVTGQHNSIINIFYRFGFIGLIFFVSFISNILKNIKYYSLPSYHYIIITISLIVISLNVGLESPKYLIFFVFCISITLSEVYLAKNE